MNKNMNMTTVRFGPLEVYHEDRVSVAPKQLILRCKNSSMALRKAGQHVIKLAPKSPVRTTIAKVSWYKTTD